VGIAFLLSGIGFLVLTLDLAGRDRQPAPATT
jgi:hypothetical protein